jgi:hypothetical protein
MEKGGITRRNTYAEDANARILIREMMVRLVFREHGTWNGLRLHRHGTE